MEKQKWLDLMSRLGLEDNLGTYAELVASYHQKHRYYHNVSHIDAVLKHLELSKSLANDSDAVEIALWFHDAIYKVFSSTNEQESASWAATFLEASGANKALSEKVNSLIMATRHDALPVDNDEKLIVDIDLSILGCSPELYDQFESWVRKEYRLVPGFIYKKKRKEILSSFLARERIYSHEYFFEKFELPARRNLGDAISNL